MLLKLHNRTQIDDQTCGPTVIAMLTGETVEDVKAEVFLVDKLDLSNGMTDRFLLRALARRGFVCTLQQPDYLFWELDCTYIGIAASMNFVGGHHYVSIQVDEDLITVRDPNYGREGYKIGDSVNDYSITRLLKIENCGQYSNGEASLEDAVKHGSGHVKYRIYSNGDIINEDEITIPIGFAYPDSSERGGYVEYEVDNSGKNRLVGLPRELKDYLKEVEDNAESERDRN